MLTNSKGGADSAKVANGMAKNVISVVKDWKEDADSAEAANGDKGGVSVEREIVTDRSSTVSLEEGVGSVEVANTWPKNAVSEEETMLTDSKEGANSAKVANGIAKNAVLVVADWKEDATSAEVINGAKSSVPVEGEVVADCNSAVSLKEGVGSVKVANAWPKNAVSEEGTTLTDSKEGANSAKVANGMAKNMISVVMDWKEDFASTEAANGAKGGVSAEGEVAIVPYH
ncbi:hypothetical protein PanWU01x14_201030 [Parasponia andersonii]|uniref:Uncharacterized protein n=1 Tax=Parasponia andersonii TaxID=3476 RepID=A0A2P5BXL0_PARAD|nr:hypothetical protein PanWU01x14_201030 [Parasponia andersonii]